MATSDALWSQFRRLLLGTVVEGLLAHHVPVDFATLAIRFDDDSAFRVPRIDNYMRFRGALTARLAAPFAGADALAATLRAAWPELLAVLDLPMGDRLAAERSELNVRIAGDLLEVAFDLEAD
ncbi:MAG: hypothetical protein ACOZNI_26315 [Myxococcota bacterium]